MYCPSHFPVQTNFRRYILLNLAQAISNSPQSIEGFRQTLGRNFNWIRQQMKNLPKDPHCKKRSLSSTLWRCRKRTIFTMGVYLEILHLLSNPIGILLQSSSKRFKWSMWVWARCYKNIAENSFALGHATDSSNLEFCYIMVGFVISI